MSKKSAVWLAVKAERKARRAADPEVQKRRRKLERAPKIEESEE